MRNFKIERNLRGDKVEWLLRSGNLTVERFNFEWEAISWLRHYESDWCFRLWWSWGRGDKFRVAWIRNTLSDERMIEFTRWLSDNVTFGDSLPSSESMRAHELIDFLYGDEWAKLIVSEMIRENRGVYPWFDPREVERSIRLHENWSDEVRREYAARAEEEQKSFESKAREDHEVRRMKFEQGTVGGRRDLTKKLVENP